MSNMNTTSLAVLVATMTALLGATMIANPIGQANAQENQTNQTNATGAAKITITKIDVDPLMKALKDNYPKLGDIKGEEDKSFVETVKDLKDAKETARTLVAANLLRDLIQLKALQDME
jgi:formate dehydrogenase maturation protein FdhE